jgi:hypothetical protein
VADAEEEEAEGVAAVAFLVVVAVAAEVVAVAAFLAVAAVAAGLVAEISPAEVPVAPLGRGTFPAAAEAVGWLIPGTPHRAPERPLDNDLDND